MTKWHQSDSGIFQAASEHVILKVDVRRRKNGCKDWSGFDRHQTDS